MAVKEITGDTLCACGHCHGHHSLEMMDATGKKITDQRPMKEGDTLVTGRCAVGGRDTLFFSGKDSGIPNPGRCSCTKFVAA